MAKYYYSDEKGDRVFIKKMDTVNETLTFTKDPSEAHTRNGSYYEVAEVDFIKFHFKDKYPQVANIKMYYY